MCMNHDSAQCVKRIRDKQAFRERGVAASQMEGGAEELLLLLLRRAEHARVRRVRRHVHVV